MSINRDSKGRFIPAPLPEQTRIKIRAPMHMGRTRDWTRGGARWHKREASRWERRISRSLISEQI